MMAFSEAARFAVPLFFAISGYFFVRSQETAAMARLTRLLKLYLFWVAAYLVADHFLHFWKTERPVIDLIFGGGAGFHLWFISGLIQCLALYYLLRVRLKLGWPALFALSGCLYLGNVLANSYALLPGLGWNPHDGPFFGLVFFCFGAWLRSTNRSAGRPVLLFGALLALTALNTAELGLMKWLGIPKPFGIPDVRMMTLPLGLTAMLCVVSLRHLEPAQSAGYVALNALANASLGVYATHVLVIKLLTPLGLPGELVYVATVIITIPLVLLLARTPLKRFV